MEKLKVCFTGIGSIANRHIKNLRTIAEKRKILLTIDAYRRTFSHVEGVDSIYTDLSDIPDDYDVIFITNPTDMHIKTLRDFHGKGKNFFIEKPVVSLSQIQEARNFMLREDSVYYVACPLRYSAVIQHIKNNVNLDDVISVRSISSSYLPNWRVGQDYRKSYSAHKTMGGGVSVDLIHEWDYLTYLFGWPQNVHSFIGKKSQLEIDSDDYAIYIAEYEKLVVELHLDYFGRQTIREIQLFTNTDTIRGDIAGNCVYYMNSQEVFDFREERNDYQKRELETFIDMIQDHETMVNGFNHGIKVLELTQGRMS